MVLQVAVDFFNFVSKPACAVGVALACRFGLVAPDFLAAFLTGSFFSHWCLRLFVVRFF